MKESNIKNMQIITRKDHALALQDKILKYKLAIEDNYYKLVKLGKIFLNEQLYLDLGFSNPEDWVREVLGYGIRKLQFLIGIEEKFAICGVTDEDRQQIEWTKARQIVRVLTPENATEWVKKARTLTVRELHDEVAGEKAARNIQDYKPIGYLYIPYYNEDQKEEYDEIMELAARITGSDRKEIQFLAMGQECKVEWLHKAEAIEGIRNKIFERDGWKCRCCGKRKNLSPHEIIPRGRMGQMGLSNSVTLCIRCHEDVTNERITIEAVGNGKWRFVRREIHE